MQGDVGPNIVAAKVGKSGNSLASRRSTRDTDVEVRSEEAKDLKKSMQEALVDYKKLLKHEVKKEELRTISDPTLAIETPVGKPLLPTLSGGNDENPAKLELRALKQQQANAAQVQGCGAFCCGAMLALLALLSDYGSLSVSAPAYLY